MRLPDLQRIGRIAMARCTREAKFEEVQRHYININHNYNKIVKSDWLSTALISALIGQFNRTVRVMPK